MSHRLTSLPLLLLSLLAAACATPAYERDWVDVRSEHFEIASAMDAEDTVELANDLETFRSVIRLLTNAERFDPIVPTRIYAFRNERDYQRYAPADSAGFFQPSMRGFIVALYPDRNIGTSAIVQHEYTHFLLRNQSSVSYPLWYNEGFAELFGGLRIVDDQVQVGRVPEYRVNSILYGEWIPIEKVVAARSLAEFPGADHMFYAEAWVLVHYLQYGREDPTATTSQLTRYLELTRQSVPVKQAWRDAFGEELDALDAILKEYLAQGPPAFAISAETFRPQLAPRSRALTRSEVASDLGWLSIVAGDPAVAELSFRAAIAEQPDQARAHAGLGDACKFQGRWEEAKAHYERALAIAPDDALTQLDYAEYLHDLAQRSPDPAERRRLIGLARQHYVNSAKLDKGLPETYAMYGSTFLLEGEDPNQGVETLEHAHELLKTDLEIQVRLALVYARTGRLDDARELLETVIAWAHDERQAASARDLLADLYPGEPHETEASPPPGSVR